MEKFPTLEEAKSHHLQYTEEKATATNVTLHPNLVLILVLRQQALQGI